MEIDRDLNPTTLKLMRAFREFHRVGGQEHAIAGCKPSEIRVLFCVKHGAGSGAIKVSEISKLLHVTSPTVTQLLKSLWSNGLIERLIDPLDRRAVCIKLTEKGENVTQQAMEQYTQSMNGLVDYLGEEESNQLAELIAKAFRYLGEREARHFHEREASMRQSQWNGDEKV
ncbi:MAG TPA: MarR family winged helix-turn-helix transcriptional regulator [Ktedonobacteraceae bacterium]|nr:MarR family winged helix-turn-helix transcriptional regulator [Ktedonobacteraceae bacterium]